MCVRARVLALPDRGAVAADGVGAGGGGDGDGDVEPVGLQAAPAARMF